MKLKDIVKYLSCMVALLLLPMLALADTTGQHTPDLVIAYSADIRGNIECSG